MSKVIKMNSDEVVKSRQISSDQNQSPKHPNHKHVNQESRSNEDQKTCGIDQGTDSEQTNSQHALLNLPKRNESFCHQFQQEILERIQKRSVSENFDIELHASRMITLVESACSGYAYEKGISITCEFNMYGFALSFHSVFRPSGVCKIEYDDGYFTMKCAWGETDIVFSTEDSFLASQIYAKAVKYCLHCKT